MHLSLSQLIVVPYSDSPDLRNFCSCLVCRNRSFSSRHIRYWSGEQKWRRNLGPRHECSYIDCWLGKKKHSVLCNPFILVSTRTSKLHDKWYFDIISIISISWRLRAWILALGINPGSATYQLCGFGEVIQCSSALSTLKCLPNLLTHFDGEMTCYM